MHLASLLNPAPEEPVDKRPSSAHGDSAEHSSRVSNDKDGYELALWRQESGLGPPALAAQRPVFGGSRFDYFASTLFCGAAQAATCLLPCKRPRVYPVPAPVRLPPRAAAGEFDEPDEDEDDPDCYAGPASASCGGRSGSSSAVPPPLLSRAFAAAPAVPRVIAPPPPLHGVPANGCPSIAPAGNLNGGEPASHADPPPSLKRKSASTRSAAKSSEPGAAESLGKVTKDDATRQRQRSRTLRLASPPSVGPKACSDSGNDSDLLVTPPPPPPAPTEAVQPASGPVNAPEVNWQSLEVPEEVWVKAQELYDNVKTLKVVQNRQPVRKRSAILAALMFILCRSHGYPRTFSELCTAANVSKRDIGMYYNLMKSVLDSQYTANQRAKPSEFLHRWCTVLNLPMWMAPAAATIYDRADSLAVVQGKCPISVSAACLWLVVWCFNHRHALQTTGFAVPEDTTVTSSATPNVLLVKSDEGVVCDQRVVCKTACVVIATLTSVFKLLLPHLKVLVDDLLLDHL
ncbi:hypothetical protein EV174_001069 [Coemansia sp. RSA 2320]|nr:hypothetical protein EV174_001069 [Coemansia sp. RSA 2320]